MLPTIRFELSNKSWFWNFDSFPIFKDFSSDMSGEMLMDVIFNIIELNVSTFGISALVSDSIFF